jgi:hypothetical protein
MPPAQSAPAAVDGTMWLNSSNEIRKAFLVGAANMLAMEEAYSKKKGTPVPEAGAMAHKAVAGMTLDDVSGRITRWYEANPGRRNMPVMGVIWLDLVKPPAAAAPR